MDTHFRPRMAAGMLLVMGVMAAGTAASAFAATSGVTVSRFATGFPSNAKGVGPMGIAVDGAQQLYAADAGVVYRFGPDGGSASAHRLSRAPAGVAGLAIGPSGQLYATRWTSGKIGEVVQLSRSNGSVIRRLAGDVACPTGLAVDPASGDLFVSQLNCAAQVVRISGGQAVPYVTAVFVDGLAFGPDGTLYIAHLPDANGFTVSAVAGTQAANPGARAGIAKLSHADGIAVGRGAGDGAAAPFVVVNRQDGYISRVDLVPDHPYWPLMTGGTRGDFVAAGPDGCLYATQTSEILKITNDDGSCQREPTAANLASGLGAGLAAANVVSTVASGRPVASTCPVNRRLTARYRARRVVGRARIYIGRRLARRVSARALRRGVTVRGLPTGRFTLVIRARTRSGRAIVIRRRYAACAGRRA